MWAILLWILTSFLSSTWDSFRKITLEESRMSTSMFSFFASLLWWIIILGIFLYFGMDFSIFNDSLYLLIIFVIVLVWFLNQYLLQHVYKNEKLSILLPFDSLDKIFIVVFWFIIFYWTDQWTSITTLLITLLTICIIIFSSIDIKNISLPKTVIIFIVHKIIRAAKILWAWFFLLKYSSIDYVILDWVFYIIFAFIAVIALKRPFKNMLNQSRKFYNNRIISIILWRSGYILGIYIIQDSGVIIATLLWFFYIAFSVFSMKFIAKDTPSKKQIILAFVVIALVWIWYYFK